MIENINAVVERVNNELFERVKMSKEVVQSKKRELAGYKHVRAGLEHIVRDIIGCSEIFTANQTSPFPFPHSHNKHKEFNRI